MDRVGISGWGRGFQRVPFPRLKSLRAAIRPQEVLPGGSKVLRQDRLTCLLRCDWELGAQCEARGPGWGQPLAGGLSFCQWRLWTWTISGLWDRCLWWPREEVAQIPLLLGLLGDGLHLTLLVPPFPGWWARPRCPPGDVG